MFVIRAVLASTLAAAAVMTVAAGSAQAAKKSPPSCAAINFRPVTGAPNDGTMDAGLYHSRFGKLILRAEVSGGMARNYFLEVNGKRLEPIKGELPKVVNSCLTAKHVKTPPPPAGDACTGERFRVVVNNAANQKYVMLFGLQGDTWKLCSASTL